VTSSTPVVPKYTQSSLPNDICDVNHRPTGFELVLLVHDQMFFFQEEIFSGQGEVVPHDNSAESA